MRRLMTAAVLASLWTTAPVLAGDPAPSAAYAKGCTAKSARVAEPAEVAANPAEFAGKCVSLDGWWRDIALYPSRAEAAQTDALSIVILDQRRVGLYLPKAQLDVAPQTAPARRWITSPSTSPTTMTPWLGSKRPACRSAPRRHPEPPCGRSSSATPTA